MEGEFKVGNFFMLKPKGGAAVKIDLIDIQHGKSFTDCTTFFGAKMYDTHSLEETKDGIVIKNTLIVTRWLKYLWIMLVAKHVADSIAEETEILVMIAKNDR